MVRSHRGRPAERIRRIDSSTLTALTRRNAASISLRSLHSIRGPIPRRQTPRITRGQIKPTHDAKRNARRAYAHSTEPCPTTRAITSSFRIASSDGIIDLERLGDLLFPQQHERDGDKNYQHGRGFRNSARNGLHSRGGEPGRIYGRIGVCSIQIDEEESACSGGVGRGEGHLIAVEQEERERIGSESTRRDT